MVVKSNVILLLFVFAGLLLAGCDVDVAGIVNRKFIAADLIGEYKAAAPEWEETLILNTDMTYSQKFRHKGDNMVKDNKGTWELKNNYLEFRDILFLRDFHKKDYSLRAVDLGGCNIRKSGEKIIISCGADAIEYQWESVRKP